MFQQNKIREVLDFAQMEIHSTADLTEFIKDLKVEERKLLQKISDNLQTALKEVEENK